MTRSYICRNISKFFINNSNTFIFRPAISYTYIFVLAQTFVLTEIPMPAQTFTFILTSDLFERYTYINLQKTTKFALKSFVWGQKHGLF